MKALDGAKAIEDIGSFYTEAQVHGGVKVSDIEEVIVKNDAQLKRFGKKLSKLGIKVRKW